MFINEERFLHNDCYALVDLAKALYCIDFRSIWVLVFEMNYLVYIPPFVDDYK